MEVNNINETRSLLFNPNLIAFEQLSTKNDMQCGHASMISGNPHTHSGFHCDIIINRNVISSTTPQSVKTE